MAIYLGDKALVEEMGDMDSATYDPTNKKQDIFAYVDSKTQNINNISASSVSYEKGDTGLRVDNVQEALEEADSQLTDLYNQLDNWAGSTQSKLTGTAEQVVGFDTSGNAIAKSLTAVDVGAVPTTRTINGKALSSNITLAASDVSALSISGGTLTGDLRIKNSTNYGTKINLGDGDYVHFSEPTDDCLEIKAKKVNFLISDTTTSCLTLNSSPLINYSTTDLTAGSSTLKTGTIYLVYE